MLTMTLRRNKIGTGGPMAIRIERGKDMAWYLPPLEPPTSLMPFNGSRIEAMRTRYSQFPFELFIFASKINDILTRGNPATYIMLIANTNTDKRSNLSCILRPVKLRPTKIIWHSVASIHAPLAVQIAEISHFIPFPTTPISRLRSPRSLSTPLKRHHEPCRPIRFLTASTPSNPDPSFLVLKP